jgi:hypothetical protein
LTPSENTSSTFLQACDIQLVLAAYDFPSSLEIVASVEENRVIGWLKSIPMWESIRSKPLAILLTCIALLQSDTLLAAQVAVRRTEGLVHGFLLLSTLEGKPLAEGDLLQVSRGNRVTSRLIFRFRDGSVHDETAVFSQHGNFRLLTYHLVQKGAAFRNSTDVSIDTSSGQVTIRYTNDEGKEKTASERMTLPPDVANGIIFTLLKNISPDGTPTAISMVAATPKPKLVKLAVTPRGEEPFSVGGSQRTAIHYVVKIEIGGVSGAIAPLVGKQPTDINVWILGGEAPAFVKSEGQLYLGGPIWRIELVSPVWRASSSDSKD